MGGDGEKDFEIVVREFSFLNAGMRENQKQVMGVGFYMWFLHIIA